MPLHNIIPAVFNALKIEELSLIERFGKDFIIMYPREVARGVYEVLNGTRTPDAKLVKAAYEAWCILALINLSKPKRVIDPSYEEFRENNGFWLRRRYRLYGIQWTRPDGSSVRDQVPTNVIWETFDSKVYSLAFQPIIGLTSLLSEQHAWFKSVALGTVWNLSRYLTNGDVRLRPDILLYKRWVENVVDFHNKLLPEIDVLVNVEAKMGWSKNRTLIKKLEDYTEAFRPRHGAFVVSLYDEIPAFKCKFNTIPAGTDKNKLKELL